MSYLDRDTYGMYKVGHKGPGPELMGAGTLTGDHVHNLQNEHLGEIKEFLLEMSTGKVAYAVLSSGGLFTMGEKLFAVPFKALKLDTVNKRFTLDAPKSRVEDAPGFDSNEWPDMADQSWIDKVHSYYGVSSR